MGTTDTTGREKAPDEVFCGDCGEIIKENAEICPECGVRQNQAMSATDGAAGYGASGPTGSQSVTTDVGLIFAFMDMKDAKRPARHLIDVILVFFTVGLYLKIMVLEWLWHYYNLKKGKYQPFDEDRDTRIWAPSLQ